MIYFDYQATTPIDPKVLKAYNIYQKDFFANPSSNHAMGINANRELEEARNNIKKLINASSAHIYFTPSATISLNIALKSLLLTAPEKRRKILALKTEHKAVLETLEFMKTKGFVIELLPVNKNGIIDIQYFQKSIDKNTILVAVMHANNEIGVIQPVEKIGKICKKYGALFMVDGAQSFVKIPFDYARSNVDFYIASSHKIYGPKGVAFLLTSPKADIFLHPYVHGGGQEGNIICGTENVPAIAAFSKAATYASEKMSKESKKLKKLRDYFITSLQKQTLGIVLNGDKENRLPGNINITISGVPNYLLIEQINQEIMISAASACTNNSASKNSHVLAALGLSPENINASIRISFGRFTTLAEVKVLVRILTSSIHSTRKKINF
jgi:cysteine desulfurase